MLIKNDASIRELVTVAARQRDTSINFKRRRIQDIQRFEDAYSLKVKPGLVGRYNFPIPILSGFVDTLLAKTDDAPSLEFNAGNNIAHAIAAKKVTSAWQEDSSEDNGNWARVDRNAKRLAAFSGIGVYELQAQDDPEYKQILSAVDYYDWHDEPNGGSNTENHLFCGRDNVYFTKEQLVENVKNGLFNIDAIKIARTTKDSKDNQTDIALKNNRVTSLNLDQNFNNYVGQEIVNLTRWTMTFKGKRYYILFDPKTLAVARVELLKDVYNSDLYPFEMWQTHEDSSMSWTKGPCDDIYPLHEMFRVNINYMMDNLNRRGYNMRAYDPSIFTDASKLNWRPDGLVPVASGTDPSKGIFTFETPDNSAITLNVSQYLNGLFGEKVGITPGAQGAAETDKVGIYYGNMQQVQDRIGLINKCYKSAQIQLGKKYKANLQQYMPEKMAVKYLGGDGIEWDELVKEDLDVKLSLNVVGANDKKQANEALAKKRADILSSITRNTELMGEIKNKKAFVEETLRLADFEDADIKRLFDQDDSTSTEVISRAMNAIDKIARNKEPQLYRGANTGFIRYIINYATDKIPFSDQKLYDKTVAYAKKHLVIAERNAVSGAIKQAPIGNELMQPAPASSSPAPFNPMSMQPSMPRQAPELANI